MSAEHAPAEAVEAARFLVDAYSKRRQTGAEPYCLIVARALLSLSSRAETRGEVIEAAINAASWAIQHAMLPADGRNLERRMIIARDVIAALRSLPPPPSEN